MTTQPNTTKFPEDVRNKIKLQVQFIRANTSLDDALADTENFIEHLLALQQQAHGAEMERQKQEFLMLMNHVVNNDKTPYYAYGEGTKGQRENNLGQLPKPGARWSTPREIARTFIKKVRVGALAPTQSDKTEGEK